MGHLYVLEIPDLQFVLNQEDIAVWELFLLNEGKRYERIHFHVTDDKGCYTFNNIGACNGQLEKVQIDFENKKVVFKQSGKSNREFENFLFDRLSQLFVRIQKDRIQFLSTRPAQRVKKLTFSEGIHPVQAHNGQRTAVKGDEYRLASAKSTRR